MTYTPPTRFCGTDTFTYCVCPVPATSFCGCALVNITVLIITTPQSYVMYQFFNTSDTLDVLANNPGGGAPNRLTVNTQPPGSGSTGTINVSSGKIVYTPPPSYAGQTNFTYTSCCATPTSNCATGTVTMTVLIYAAPDVVTTNENTNVNIPVLNNDPGSGVVSTLRVSLPATNGGTTVNSNGTITYNPNTGFVGVDTFWYQICAATPAGNCANTTVTVTVQLIPQPDSAITTQVASPPSPNVTIAILNNDATLSFLNIPSLTITTQPTNGTVVTTASGNAVYTPDFSFAGDDTFIYQICAKSPPGNTNCGTAQVIVRVQIIALSRYYEVQEGTDASVGTNGAQLLSVDLLQGTPTQSGNLFGPNTNTPNPVGDNNPWYWWDDSGNSQGFDFSEGFDDTNYWSSGFIGTASPPYAIFLENGYLNGLVAQYTLCSPILQQPPNCATNNVTVFVRIKAVSLPRQSSLSTRTVNQTQVIDIYGAQPAVPAGQTQPVNASSIVILGYLNATNHVLLPSLPPAWGIFVFFPNFPTPGAGNYTAPTVSPPTKSLIFSYLVCALNNSLNCDNSTVSISFGTKVGGREDGQEEESMTVQFALPASSSS